MVREWKAEIIFKIVVNEYKLSIIIEDPPQDEIINAPFFKGNVENAREEIVRRKAKEIANQKCGLLAFERKSPVDYKLDNLVELENSMPIRNIREASFTIDSIIGQIMTPEDFSTLDEELSKIRDDLVYRYCYLYNRSLKTKDVAE